MRRVRAYESRWARLAELTHDQPAEKVWEMRLQEDDLDMIATHCR